MVRKYANSSCGEFRKTDREAIGFVFPERKKKREEEGKGGEGDLGAQPPLRSRLLRRFMPLGDIPDGPPVEFI